MIYVLCIYIIMYYVLCIIMYYVLCIIMYYVLCIMYYVLCIMYVYIYMPYVYVLCIMYMYMYNFARKFIEEEAKNIHTTPRTKSFICSFFLVKIMYLRIN